MELYNDFLLAIVLGALAAYVFVGGIVAKRQGNFADEQEYARCVVFWPYYLAKPHVRAFWCHVRSPKPPNRTKV